MPRHLVSLLDLDRAELDRLLVRSAALAEAFRRRELPAVLTGRGVALIWDATGFRNRVAFELGIAAMGGRAVQVPGALDERESIEDVAAYLGNWFDAIVVRARHHAHVERLAAAARVPVINARTDFNHPCEVLGDLAWIRQRRGDVDGLRVAFFGEAANLSHTWLEAAARQPITVVQCCPPGYAVDPALVARCLRDAVGGFEHVADPDTALRAADVVYTDCWPSAADETARGRIAAQFAPYRITAERLARAAADVVFLPCPPVHRGEEVSADAMSSPACQVVPAKAYLLHAQNALLEMLLAD